MSMTKIDAPPQQPDLGEQMLACFRQACSERRMEVAEHLLVAVEQLCAEDSDTADAVRYRQLSEAYGTIMQLAGPTGGPR